MVEESDFGVDYTLTGGKFRRLHNNNAPTFDLQCNTNRDDVSQTEQEEYENAGLTEEQKMHIEELSNEKIKQQKDPKHNQW